MACAVLRMSEEGYGFIQLQTLQALDLFGLWYGWQVPHVRLSPVCGYITSSD